jgi:phytol kinase
VAFLVGVLVLTGWLNIFKAVHAVKRWTIGEFLYPLAGATIAFMYDDVVVYTVSITMLALADGMAGLIGRQFGGKGYKVWGGTKSLVGNLAFFVTAVFVLSAFVFVFMPGASNYIWITVIGASSLLTIIEAAFGGGFDNLAVPFATAIITSYMLTLV